jgi:hypothetical protein
MRNAIDEMIESEMLVHAPMRLALLTDAALQKDRLDIAKVALAQAFHYSGRNAENWSDAELFRLEGMMSWHRGDLIDAKRLLRKAYGVAERGNALSFQLRAAIGLAEYELGSGFPDGAVARLAILCSRFEDVDSSVDLIKARKLLQSLAPRPIQAEIRQPDS